MMSKFCSNNKEGFTHLYPHEFDNYRIIIPKQTPYKFKIASNQLIIIVIIIFLLMFSFIIKLFYLIFNKRHSYIKVVLNVFGLYLTTSYNLKSKYLTGRILIILLSFFSLLTIGAINASVYRSSIIYDKNITTTHLKDVEQLKMNILIDKDVGVKFSMWGKTLRYLQLNFDIVEESDIIKLILKKDISNAYALPTSKASLFINIENTRENNVDVFSIIDEYLSESYHYL